MRVGVVGPFGPDLFAENLGDALQCAEHVVTQLGPAGANPRSSGHWSADSSQAGVPRLDERSCHLSTMVGYPVLYLSKTTRAVTTKLND